MVRVLLIPFLFYLTACYDTAPYSFPRSGVKDPDLIIEFNETRGEKFRIPREIVACEQEITQSRQRDIVMYTFVPFVNDDAVFKKAHKVPKSSTQTVIRLRNASHPLWECIRGWVNEESKKADAWDYFFDKVSRIMIMIGTSSILIRFFRQRSVALEHIQVIGSLKANWLCQYRM